MANVPIYLRSYYDGAGMDRLKQDMRNVASLAAGAVAGAVTLDRAYQFLSESVSLALENREHEAEKIDGVTEAYDELKEAIGATLIPEAEHVGLLERAIDGYTMAIDQLHLISEAHEDYQKSLEGTAKWQTVWGEALINILSAGTLSVFDDAILGTLGLARGNEELAVSYAEVVDAQNLYNLSIKELIPDLSALEQANQAITKEREQRAKITRSTIKQLQDIEKDSYDDRLDAAKDFQKDIADLQRKARRDAANDARRTSRALQKVDKDAAKQIQKARDNARKEEANNRKREQVETIADRRLFMLNLQHMAEDGDAIGIRRALERREIEEQIAKEQAQVEAQIAEQQQKDEAAQIRETANERKAAIVEQSNLEQELRKEDLARRIADETEYYNERQALIEQGRLDAVSEVGKELTDIEGMTKGQLMNLIPMASQLGRDVGASFATGITEGYAQNAQVSQIVNQNVTVTATGPGARELSNDMASGVNRIMQQYNNLLRRSFAQ